MNKIKQVFLATLFVMGMVVTPVMASWTFYGNAPVTEGAYGGLAFDIMSSGTSNYFVYGTGNSLYRDVLAAGRTAGSWTDLGDSPNPKTADPAYLKVRGTSTIWNEGGGHWSAPADYTHYDVANIDGTPNWTERLNITSVYDGLWRNDTEYFVNAADASWANSYVKRIYYDGSWATQDVIRLPGASGAMAMDSDYLYVASGGGDIYWYPLTTVNNAIGNSTVLDAGDAVKTVTLNGASASLAVTEDYLLAAGYDGYVQWYNLSDGSSGNSVPDSGWMYSYKVRAGEGNIVYAMAADPNGWAPGGEVRIYSTVIPEPGSIMLFGMGSFSLLLACVKRFSYS